MTFQPGHKLSKGRPKGSLTARSLGYAKALEEANFDPAKAKLLVFNEAYQNYQTCSEDRKPVYLQIALSAAEKMAPYVYPKLSSIEIKQESQFSGMSISEKIEAMKNAIKLLESQEKE